MMAAKPTAVEVLLRRERLIVLVSLAVLIGLSWGWVLSGAGTGMRVAAMTSGSFPPPVYPALNQTWSVDYALLMFIMWSVMMIAMMLPSATPMILLYARAYRYEQKLAKLPPAVIPTLAFAAGYLIVWMGFSLVATGLQWGLERAGLVHAMHMWSLSPVFSALLLIAAGSYQLSSLKNVCLNHCRSPAQFLAEYFQPGTKGAVRMGIRHGLFCLGCCGFLMGLLFAGGIMNLIWIAGLALFVLLEKLIPAGPWLARIAGVVLIAAGCWIVIGV